MQILLVVIPIILIFIFFTVILLLFLVLASSFYSDFNGAPYIGNDIEVIKKSLLLADVSNKTKLVDLGSGNGKVLKIARDDFDVKDSLGYEIAPWPYLISKLHKVKTYRKSFFDVDLTKYDVVYVYLLPKLLEKLSFKIIELKKTKPDVKIVSPVFKIHGLNPQKVESCYHKGFKKEVLIFLY